MQVIINSDNHVELDRDSREEWQSEIETSLQRFGSWITRVEVQLTDENSQAKGGLDDIRCLMEARPASHQPVSVEVRAASADQALQEGMGSLRRRLTNILDKARSEQRKRQ